MAPSAPKAMIISSLDGAHFVDPGVFDQAIVGENFFFVDEIFVKQHTYAPFS